MQKMSFKKGFSLIEIMFGILMVAVLAAGILASQGTGIRSVRSAKDLQYATKILQEAYEFVQASTYVTIQGWGFVTDQDFETITGYALLNLANLNDGALTISVQAYDANSDGVLETGEGAADEIMRKITIKASFTKYGGETTETRQITTLICDK